MVSHVIRVVDFETTGMEPPAQVVEAGYCDLTKAGPDAPWNVEPPVSWLCGVDAVPPEARAVHHIRLEEVAGKPPFDREHLFHTTVAPTVVAAHNYAFEAAFLGEHRFPAICTYKAALRAWPQAPAHSNGVLRYWLEDQGLVSLTHEMAMPPHRAGPDAYVTAHILAALLQIVTAKEMVVWTREPRLLPTCPIGKFRGKPWAEVEVGFLNWILAQTSMEPDLKWNAQRELELRRSVV